jgi:hypothetical protein
MPQYTVYLEQQIATQDVCVCVCVHVCIYLNVRTPHSLSLPPVCYHVCYMSLTYP